MRLHKSTLLFIILVLMTSIGCEIFNSDEGNEANVIRRDNKVFIQDRTGKSWDVTHAASNYGFVPEQFQFGLGPFAIPPILNPQMVEQGQSGYPSSSDQTRVIGTTINRDTRAYPLSVLRSHEIADERFDSTYVAVAY